MLDRQRSLRPDEGNVTGRQRIRSGSPVKLLVRNAPETEGRTGPRHRWNRDEISRSGVVKSDLATRDHPARLIGDLDNPELLRPASMDRSGRRGNQSFGDPTKKIGAVVHPDARSSAAGSQPCDSRDARNRFHNCRVHPTVDDSV